MAKYVRYDVNDETFQRYVDLANEAGSRMSKVQLEAFSYYTGDGHKQMTREIYGDAISPVNAVRMAEMDAALDASIVPENVLVFRGTNLPASALEAGATFTDLGYVSATANRNEAIRWAMKNDDYDEDYPTVLLTIRVKQGQKMLFAGGCSINPFEVEVLFPRNVQFVVKHVEENDFGHTFATVEVL